MKNPTLDAIRKLKAKRAMQHMEGEEGFEQQDDPQAVPGPDESEDSEQMSEGHGEEEGQEHGLEEEGEEDQLEASSEDAEELMGRKPFAKNAGDDEEEIDEEVLEDLYDEKAARRLEGRKPKSLFERAQMKLASKLGK